MFHNPHLSVASAAFPIVGGDLFHRPVFPLSVKVITVEDPQSTDEKLNNVIKKLIPVALERRQGILVIQRDYGKYTVQVDSEVPCGTTQEGWCEIVRR